MNAALKGATLAFNGRKTDTAKPELKPKPAPTTPNPKARDNEALQAAAQASRERSLVSPYTPTTSRSIPISRQTTGDSFRGAVSPGGYFLGHDLEHGAAKKGQSQYLGSSPQGPQSLLSGARPSPDNRSASFIAATLAASRSASASPSPHHMRYEHGGYSPQPGHSPLKPEAMRNKDTEKDSVQSSTAGKHLPDTTSIPPTNSLISMFEKHANDADSSKAPVERTLSSRDQATLAPKPRLRAMTPPRSLSPQGRVQPRDEVWTVKQRGRDLMPSLKPKPTMVEPSSTSTQVSTRVSTEISSPEPRRPGLKPSSQPPPAPPKPAVGTPDAAAKPIQQRGAPVQKQDVLSSSSSDILSLTVQSKRDGLGREALVPTRRSSGSSDSSNDSFVSASSTRSPTKSPVRATESSEVATGTFTSTGSVPAPPQSRNLRKATSMTSVKPCEPPSHRPAARTNNSNSSVNLPLDSLTDAIMASNLAATRHVPSSALPPPVPAPRRSGNHHHKHGLHIHHHQHHHTTKKQPVGENTSTSRSPQRAGTSTSTTTALLTTLRRPRSASEDEELRNRHRRHVGKHRPLGIGNKHIHHEGTRKRWRDEVSVRERKRYEAVWASNRGQFYPPASPSSTTSLDSDTSQLVINIVVRDIWSRSRLPFDELAEVWDLVYRGRSMGLNREEFVVGMWLIDQRLRGRKIPARVSDSVWYSTRGMRVKMPKGKSKHG